MHPSIRGTVAVHSIVLDAPRQTGAPGRAFPLHGRSGLAPGTEVTIEADTGSGFAGVARTPVGADSAFATTVTLPASATLRARSGDATSPSVTLLVVDRSVSVHHAGRSIVAKVTPAAPGATVVLQILSRDHFGWWPIARVKLDARSGARFRRPRRHAPTRVVATLPDGATPLAYSRVLR